VAIPPRRDVIFQGSDPSVLFSHDMLEVSSGQERRLSSHIEHFPLKPLSSPSLLLSVVVSLPIWFGVAASRPPCFLENTRRQGNFLASYP